MVLSTVACYSVLLEQPALSQRVGVYQSGTVLHVFILGGDSPRHGAVDLTGGLDRLHGPALLPHLQAGPGVRQLGVHHLAQGVRRVLRDPDGAWDTEMESELLIGGGGLTYVTIQLDVLVLLGEVILQSGGGGAQLVGGEGGGGDDPPGEESPDPSYSHGYTV